MGTLSGDVVRPALRLGPRLVHASSSCGAEGRFAVGAAGALKHFPVCQRATQAMSVVTLIRGWVLARHRLLAPRPLGDIYQATWERQIPVPAQLHRHAIDLYMCLKIESAVLRSWYLEARC